MSRIKVDKSGRLIIPEPDVSLFERKLLKMSSDEIFEKYQDGLEYGLFIHLQEEPDWENPATYDNNWAANLDESLTSKIKQGYSPTEDEIEDLRDTWLEFSLSSEADGDAVDGFELHEDFDESGQSVIVLLMVSGYSWSGVTITLKKVFSSIEKVYLYMNENGWYNKS